MGTGVPVRSTMTELTHMEMDHTNANPVTKNELQAAPYQQLSR